MEGFIRHNKKSYVYWLKCPLDNIKIRVKIKPQDGRLAFPKFDDYAKEKVVDTFDKTNEYTFGWQEKIFSQWEITRYSEQHNCVTDSELNYNNLLNNTDHEPSKVFTYVHEDYHLPMPQNNVILQDSSQELSNCFGKMSLNDRIQNVLSSSTSSTRNLFRSEEDIGPEGPWRAMHIVFDNSEYNEDSQVIYKREAILLSVFHNVQDNYILLSPDSNDLEMNPYSMETESGVSLPYEYSVGIYFEDDENDNEEFMAFLDTIRKRWEKKHRHILNFSMPPLGTKIYYINFEILTACEFEMHDIYVEFNIKIPDEVVCTDPTHGRTHVSSSVRHNDGDQWHFGHTHELTLETPIGVDPTPVKVFFEVISIDWWGRHRTEGYTCLTLPLEPGDCRRLLSCSRPDEKNRIEAQSRRFFVGGCHLIKDLDVIAKPQLKDANFIYTTTGKIDVRWHTLLHSRLPGHVENVPEGGTPGGSASALLQGAEAVLKQYKKAKARLAAATKDLDAEDSANDR